MSLRVWVGIACWCAALALMVSANYLAYSILEEVNDRRPNEHKISGIFLNLKMHNILREHAEGNPDSPKRRQMWLLGIGGLTLSLAGFIAIILR